MVLSQKSRIKLLYYLKAYLIDHQQIVYRNGKRVTRSPKGKCHQAKTAARLERMDRKCEVPYRLARELLERGQVH